MATPIRLAVLLKPDDAQPALDRAAQYARVNPEIEVVAIRIVNNYKDSEIEQLRSKENAKFESLKRLYSSIEKFSFKVLFDKDVADTFTDECRNGSYSIAVISANKRHTIRDIFISSIDSSIMRNSTIPLLVVKSASQTATLGQNVLLAIDFNEVAHLDKLDDYLFEAASQFAKSFDSKVHLAKLIVICILKQLYSINEICNLINLALEGEEIKDSYNKFCEELENAIYVVFDKKEMRKKELTDKQYIMRTVVLSFSNKLYVEKNFLNKENNNEK